ncbi:alpha/beta-hydrolase [Penicillium hispanicum]|uniref:alpha/beta-hydrolase n=1 Tax=Penicillium hispanicum TaxID=1080232 RepID=UPI002540B19A|nr:alpha/beta-hydrolase [Penicillium hispanicum]KAJ5591942.1 alpha/beta-hydrolase [Penicillium hispanicum]
MSIPSAWISGEQLGRASIGTHSLFLTTAGPKRQIVNGRLQPAVIIEAGLCSSHLEWAAVARMLADYVRVYSYDRAGYGLSEPGPTQEYTAHRCVQGLSRLLDTSGIEPPYVLIGHSYGGVLVREFLRQHPRQVAGMIIVDSPRVRTPIPYDWSSLVGDSTYHAIGGLDDNCVLSEEEYAAVKRDEEQNFSTAAIEERFMEFSMREINEALPEDCQALSDARLSVIFARESVHFGKVYKYALQHGFGTEEARQRMIAWLKTA